MDLSKSGKLLKDLRTAKGLTQKQVADKMGILPKTVSKWETGNGFPDISSVSSLSEILGVSVDALLAGELKQKPREAGNMRRLKFYVCPQCGSILQATGQSSITCCGKQLESLKPAEAQAGHELKVSEVEDEYYVEMDHQMTKTHYISFIACVNWDRVMLVKLYPEQECAARFPRMRGGKFVYYCNQHGLFVQNSLK